MYALDAATGGEVWSDNVGASIQAPDERNGGAPLTGLGIGQGLIVVPARRSLSAFVGTTMPPPAPGADCNLADYPTSKGSLNLKSANLSGCFLPGANLSGATATNANMAGAYLGGANLISANLSQANLRNGVLSGANLTAATWNKTTCPDGTDSTTNGGTCTGHLG